VSSYRDHTSSHRTEDAPSHEVDEPQAATYNVNGRKPAPGLDLQPWLASGHGADIVAVGFQEIVPLNAGNVMTGYWPTQPQAPLLHQYLIECMGLP